MIVWGGSSRGRLFNDGAAYNPETSTWRQIAPAPIEGRTGHTTVWTGDEMIVWGGCCEQRGDEFGDGAAYNPELNTWRMLPPAPIHARTGHTAVRGLGKRTMVIWGGHVFDKAFDDGAVYDAEMDSWRKLPPSGIVGRYSHGAVFDGFRMIVWGGATTEPNILGDGASFAGMANREPAYDIDIRKGWTPIRSNGPPRSSYTALSVGEEMIVWGGCCSETGEELGGGAVYDPQEDLWRRLPPAGLSPRQGHTATFTGRRMVIWGGAQGLEAGPVGLADGAAYDPTTNKWSAVPPSTLRGRFAHSAVMTSDDILVWGGCCDEKGVAFSDGAVLDLLEARIPSLSNEQVLSPPPDDVSVLPPLIGILLGVLFALGLIVLFAVSWRRKSAEPDG
jgi:N-acetylneuraminic acid mutarotase